MFTRTTSSGRLSRRFLLPLLAAASAVLTIGSGVATATPSQAAQPDTSHMFWLTPEQLSYAKAHPGQVPADALPFGSSPTAVHSNLVQPLDQQGPYVVLYGYSDLRGTYAPIRKGNSAFGYEHYAYAHGLTSPNPIHQALQTHTPDVNQGAHLEYIAYGYNPDNLSVFVIVRVVVQAASRTDDGVYKTPDGKNIGVITAYCQGVTVCPTWANN